MPTRPNAPPRRPSRLLPTLLPALFSPVGCHGETAPPAPGTCAIAPAESVSVTPGDRPLGLGFHHGIAWVLVAGERSGAPSLRAVGLRPGTPTVTVTAPLSHPVEAPGTLAAVSDLVRTPDGPAFAVARGRAVTAVVLGDPPREVLFPRGPTPPARDLVTPSIALSADPGAGLSVLARWPAPWGVHRFHTRDVYESRAYTPARRDAFAAPEVTVVGDTALVVQEHRVGRFVTDGESRREIELVALPANPWGLDGPRVVRLSPSTLAAGTPRAPHVTPADPDAPSRGVIAVWRDDRGLLAARAFETRGEGWALREFVRVGNDPAATDTLDVGPAHGACGTVVAWRSERAGAAPTLVARAVDVSAGRAGAAAEAPLGPSGGASRVAVARAGARTYVATGTADGVRLWEASQDADCALTLRPVTAPGAPLGPGTRLVGMSGDARRAVLAATTAAPDATETSVTFVTLDGATGRAQRVPAAATVRFGVDAVALASDAVVIGGRGRNGVWVQRIGPAGASGTGPGDGPGEDLLFRGTRGAEFSLAASATHHRVWLADVAGDEVTPFGPPRSVVLYSAVEALEDGPRTEVRTGVVPDADFARLTLDPVTPVTAGGAWAATWSGAADPAPDCVPGAYAALYASADDHPVALATPDPSSPWPWARSLVDASVRQCGDRVQAVAWDGPRITAVVTGAGVGARLVTGDVTRGPLRSEALDARTAGAPAAAGLARAGNGWVVAWVDATVGGRAAVRYRLFGADGAARGPTGTVAEGVTAPEGDAAARGLPVASGADGALAVAYATAQGPRVSRLRCTNR